MHRHLLVCLLAGSAAAMAQSPGNPLRLTLRQAIETALGNLSNPDLRIALEAERIAGARHDQGRASMLPSFESSVAGQNQTRNLAAQGFQFDTSVPNFTIPETVGPFNTLDARVAMTQPVFDLGAIRRLRAASMRTVAAREDGERRRDELAAQVAHLYARALRDDAELEAAEAAIGRARVTLESVRNRMDAGSGIGIDVKRAEHQVTVEQQRRADFLGDREQTVLALLEAIGKDFGAQLEFADRLDRVKPVTDPDSTTVEAALGARADLAAQRKRQESFRIDGEALRLETLPTVSAYADAGVLGRRETHTIALTVRVPIFDGGRRKAREAEMDAMARQEGARAEKIGRAIELQVRQARIAMRSAAGQVGLAEESEALATAEWDHSRRRHDAGITGLPEVLEAQSRLAATTRQRVDALFRYLEARIDALFAAGAVRDLTI